MGNDYPEKSLAVAPDDPNGSLDHALTRLLAGEATSDDLETVEQSLAVPLVSVGVLNEVAVRIGDINNLPKPQGFDAHNKWQDLQGRLPSKFDKWVELSAEALPPSSSSIPRKFIAAARVGVATFLLATLMFVLSTTLFKGAEQTATPTTIATRNGQQSTVTLLDGTLVTLNVASRLEIPPDFSSGNRVVRLNGEAMFSVIHASGSPFTVISGNATTRVLGTTFSVRHYDTDTLTSVIVQDGKVSVQSVVLATNQQADVAANDTVWVRTSDPTRFAFSKGVLIIDGVPLKDAIPDLNRWYDADIRIGHPMLAVRPIKAQFSVGAVSELMEVLEILFNARVVQDGKTITLYPREL